MIQAKACIATGRHLGSYTVLTTIPAELEVAKSHFNKAFAFRSLLILQISILRDVIRRLPLNYIDVSWRIYIFPSQGLQDLSLIPPLSSHSNPPGITISGITILGDIPIFF